MFVSDEGKIHKIVQWTRNGDSQSALLDIFDVTPGEPIQVHIIFIILYGDTIFTIIKVHTITFT